MVTFIISEISKVRCVPRWSRVQDSTQTFCPHSSLPLLPHPSGFLEEEARQARGGKEVTLEWPIPLNELENSMLKSSFHAVTFRLLSHSQHNLHSLLWKSKEAEFSRRAILAGQLLEQDCSLLLTPPSPPANNCLFAVVALHDCRKLS